MMNIIPRCDSSLVKELLEYLKELKAAGIIEIIIGFSRNSMK